MIKLFISDLDGTLLNPNLIISDRTALAIHQVQDLGIEFMVATGRSYQSAKPLLAIQNIHCQMICLNGAASYNANGQITRLKALTSDQVYAVINYCQAHHLDYTVFSLENLYMTNIDEYSQQLFDFSKDLLNYLDEQASLDLLRHIQNIRPANQLDMTGKEDILKIMIFCQDPQHLANIRDDLSRLDQLEISSSDTNNLEITHIEANKGQALSDYLQTTDYRMDQVAAIGDSFNDSSMLELAGYSFAMANAQEEILALAQYTAPANNYDGVAQILEKIIQEKNPNFD